jgi:hypothetical protein
MVDPIHRRLRRLPKIEVRRTCCCSTRRNHVMTTVMACASMAPTVIRVVELIMHLR